MPLPLPLPLRTMIWICAMQMDPPCRPAGAHVHRVDSWELEPLHADAVGWQPRTLAFLHASLYECISIRSHCTVVLLTLCCSMMAVLIPKGSKLIASTCIILLLQEVYIYWRRTGTLMKWCTEASKNLPREFAILTRKPSEQAAASTIDNNGAEEARERY